MDIIASKHTVIPVGRLGENEHVRVLFEITDYLKQYPGATFSLLNRLPGQSASYIVNETSVDDQYLYWSVASSALTHTGLGQCELVVRQGDVVAKSVIYTTQVLNALDGAGSAPDPWESWVDQFSGYVEAAQTQAANAAASADSAEHYADVCREYTNDYFITSDISGNHATLDGGALVQGITVAAENTATITRCGVNLLPKFAAGTSSDVSWTVDSDGVISLTGTASADFYLRLQNLSIPAGGKTCCAFNSKADYDLTFTVRMGSTNKMKRLTEQNMILTYTDSDLTGTITEILIRIPSGFDTSGMTLKPFMTFESSVTEYVPYAGQTYNVTLDANGVVQEDIPLTPGINNLWANEGNITVSLIVPFADFVDQKVKATEPAFYRYEASGSAKYLYIYYKSGGNYVRWQLHNVPTAASNSNTWQIGHVMGFDADMTNGVELVAGGEFELAFREHGSADFCGGNNHGDENTDSFSLFIDGKQITLSSLDTLIHPFTRIDAIEIATINRCDTPSENILKHQKVWTFEDGKVRVRQTIKYLTQLDVDGVLVCMFAANRESFPYGVRQGGIGIEVMTDSSYTSPRLTAGEIFYEMYGTNATAKIRAKTDCADGNSKLWVNPTPVLNKLYYTYYANAASAAPITVPADTIITAESEYDVAYTPAG